MKTHLARFSASLAAKLGRCPRCMRISFRGFGLAWLALAACQAFWPGSVAWYGSALAALVWTVWFLAHVVAYAARRAGTAPGSRPTSRAPERSDSSAPSGTSRREVFRAFCRGAAGALVVSVPGARRVWAADDCPDCNCYFSRDCNDTKKFCDVTASCKYKGKLDGICKDIPPPKPTGRDRESLALMLDLIFQAYLDPVNRGTGDPNPVLLVQAQRMRFRHSADWFPQLVRTVEVVVDTVIGFDFIPGGRTACSALGHIRMVHDPEGGRAILNAARAGLLQAFALQDPRAVEAPLQAFWERFPDYVPMHTGRCYPHGHPEVTDALDCQIDTMTRIARALLAPGR